MTCYHSPAGLIASEVEVSLLPKRFAEEPKS